MSRAAKRRLTVACVMAALMGTALFGWKSNQLLQGLQYANEERAQYEAFNSAYYENGFWDALASMREPDTVVSIGQLEAMVWEAEHSASLDIADIVISSTLADRLPSGFVADHLEQLDPENEFDSRYVFTADTVDSIEQVIASGNPEPYYEATVSEYEIDFDAIQAYTTFLVVMRMLFWLLLALLAPLFVWLLGVLISISLTKFDTWRSNPKRQRKKLEASNPDMRELRELEALAQSGGLDRLDRESILRTIIQMRTAVERQAEQQPLFLADNIRTRLLQIKQRLEDADTARMESKQELSTNN